MLWSPSPHGHTQPGAVSRASGMHDGMDVWYGNWYGVPVLLRGRQTRRAHPRLRVMHAICMAKGMAQVCRSHGYERRNIRFWWNTADAADQAGDGDAGIACALVLLEGRVRSTFRLHAWNGPCRITQCAAKCLSTAAERARWRGGGGVRDSRLRGCEDARMRIHYLTVISHTLQLDAHSQVKPIKYLISTGY